MKAYNTNIYPVFEADQVLSQKELNNLVSHLEEQDRITRKNLTGIGIVCGLELSFPAQTSVKIGCGTAVTSLGFQINWEEQTLSHYRDYELSEQFLKPDYLKEPYLDNIFKYSKQYEPIKKCIELLPSASTSPENKVIPAGFFDDKVVALLLEVTLIDLKNCVTTNCDDKGKRIEFNIRPILIPISKSTKLLIPQNEIEEKHPSITLPRFNVPLTKLVTGGNISKSFEKILDNNLLLGITNAINKIYQDFKPLLPDNSEFTVLTNSKAKIDETVNIYKSGNNIQYLWDWISDIAQAYNEIIDYENLNPGLCCVDESLFPFHVVLGTNDTDSDTYRTGFYKTLNAAEEENLKLKKLILLFERLTLVINSFDIATNSKIRITPSSHGNYPLSHKSIPFYYDTVLELNKKWNPKLTQKKQNDTILSYHSDLAGYTDLPSVKEPLLFDLEKYNFFRIEGHIGRNYLEAITEIQTKIQEFRLPFKVVAVNAVDDKGRTLKMSLQSGVWDDLELDYDLAKEKVYNITEYVIVWIKTNKAKIQEIYPLMTDLMIANLQEILVETRKLLSNDLKEFLPNYETFNEVFEGLNDLFLSHRKCITTFSIGKNEPIIEDLVDHFDEINMLFLEDAFTVINDEVERRWKQSYKETFLSQFAGKHPSLDHKAGVTAGGTFVLVYSDYTIFNPPKPTIRADFILDKLKSYETMFKFSDADKEEIKSSNVVRIRNIAKKAGKAPIELNDDCKETATKVGNQLMDNAIQNIKTNFPIATQTFMLAQLEPIFNLGIILNPSKTNPDSTPQKVILADFFLPYLCCTEGSSVNFIIENTPAETKTGDFQSLDFNANDFNTNL